MKDREKINFLLLGFFLVFVLELKIAVSLIFIYTIYRYIKTGVVNYRGIFMFLLGIFLMNSIFKWLSIKKHSRLISTML